MSWRLQIGAMIVVLAVLPAASAKKRKKPGKRPAPAKKADKPTSTTTALVAEDAPAKPTKSKEQSFDFTGFELSGSMRMPQLLYFLDRAQDELDRATLEKRSFVPEIGKATTQERF